MKNILSILLTVVLIASNVAGNFNGIVMGASDDDPAVVAEQEPSEESEPEPAPDTEWKNGHLVEEQEEPSAEPDVFDTVDVALITDMAPEPYYFSAPVSLLDLLLDETMEMLSSEEGVGELTVILSKDYVFAAADTPVKADIGVTVMDGNDAPVPGAVISVEFLAGDQGLIDSLSALSVVAGKLVFPSTALPAGTVTLAVVAKQGESEGRAILVVAISHVVQPPTLTLTPETLIFERNGVVQMVAVAAHDEESAEAPGIVWSASPEGIADISFEAGEIRVLPLRNQQGNITITVKATSTESGLYATRTVSVEISGGNAYPEIPGTYALETSGGEPASLDLLSIASDEDGDPLSFAVTDGATHGVVSIEDGLLTYMPGLYFHGGDTFSITVSDGKGGEAVCVFAVTVTPVNYAPIMPETQALDMDEMSAYPEDEPVTFSLDGFAWDPNGDNILYFVSAPASYGTVDIDPVKLVLAYTPTLYFNGADSFTLAASDGNGGLAECIFTATIRPVDSVPILMDDVASTLKSQPIVIDVLANDSCPDEHDDPPYVMTIASVSSPTAEGGTATIQPDGRSVLYTPKHNFRGTDTFTYTVEHAGTHTATVTVEVIPVNYPPEFINVWRQDEDAPFVYTMLEDSSGLSVYFELTDDDTPPDGLTVQSVVIRTGGSDASIVQSAQIDTIDKSEGRYSLTVVPYIYKHGMFQVKLIASDDLAQSELVLTFIVTHVNHPPVAKNVIVYVDEHEILEFYLRGSTYATDVDGDPLVFSIMSETEPAKTEFFEYDEATGLVRFLGLGHFKTSASFTFRVFDGEYDSNIGTVTIVSRPINDPPEFDPITPNPVILDGDTSILVPLRYWDWDDDELYVSARSDNESVINFEGLKIEETDGLNCLRITPLLYTNWGLDKGVPITVTVTVADGHFETTRTLGVYVNPVQHRPRANDVFYETEDGTALIIRPAANSIDYDGDPLTVVIDTMPTIGALTNLGDNTYLYEAPAGYRGVVSIPFHVEDWQEHTESEWDPDFPEGVKKVSHAVVYIHVHPRETNLSINQVPSRNNKINQEIEPIELTLLGVPAGQAYTLTVSADNTALTSQLTLGDEGGPYTGMGTGDAITVPLQYVLGVNETGESLITVTLACGDKENVMQFKVFVLLENLPPVAKMYTPETDAALCLVQLGTDSVFPVAEDAELYDIYGNPILPTGIRLLKASTYNTGLGAVQFNTDVGTVTFRARGDVNGRGPWGPVTINYTVADPSGMVGEGSINVLITTRNRPPVAQLRVVGIQKYGDGVSRDIQLNPIAAAYDRDGDTMYMNSITPIGDAPPVTMTETGVTAHLDGTEAGWYEYSYMVKSKFMDNDDLPWDMSGTSTVWLGIEDEEGRLVPRNVGTWWEIYAESGQHTFSLTGLIFGRPQMGWIELEVISGGNLLTPEGVTYTPSSEDEQGASYSFSLTPAYLRYGTVQLRYRAWNDVGPSQNGWSTLTVYILPINHAPELETEAEEISISKDETFTFDVYVTDPDNESPDNETKVPPDHGLSFAVRSTNNAVIDTAAISVTHEPGTSLWQISITGTLPGVLLYGEADLILAATDGEAMVEKIVRVIVKDDVPPVALDIEPRRIAEDTLAFFDVVTEENNPNFLNITVELEPGFDSAVGAVIATNRYILFSPAKDFFHKDPDAYAEIRYRLIGGNGVPSSAGYDSVIYVHVEPRDDRPITLGLDGFYSMIADEPMSITFSVLDVDRGFIWNGVEGVYLGEDSVTFEALYGSEDDEYFEGIGVSWTYNSLDHSYLVTLVITPKMYVYHYDKLFSAINITAKHNEEIPCDGTASFNVQIIGVNHPPYYKEDPEAKSGELIIDMAIREDEPLLLNIVNLFDDYDIVYGDKIALTVVSGGVNGRAVNAGGGRARFTPTPDYFTKTEDPAQSDYGWFDFVISDTANATFSGKVRIFIERVNKPPVARNFTVTTNGDQAVTVENPLKHVTDVHNTVLSGTNYKDSDVYLIGHPTGVQRGTFTFVEETGAYIYDPEPDWFGTERLTYTVSNGEANEATGELFEVSATITIVVNPVNHLPRMAFQLDSDEGGAWRFDYHREDLVWRMKESVAGALSVKNFFMRAWDVDFERYLPILIMSVPKGVLFPHADNYQILMTNDEDRTVTMRPALNTNGKALLTFTLTDTYPSTTVKHVVMYVDPVNTPPVIANRRHTMVEDGAEINSTVTATDRETPTASLDFKLVDGEDLVMSAESELGILALTDDPTSAGQTYTYNPKPDRFGEDVFTVRVTDTGNPGTDPGNIPAPPTYTDATITFTIAPVNDPPTTPADVAISGGVEVGGKPAFRSGVDLVIVTWTQSDDFHWVQETPQEDLLYSVEYTINATTWTALSELTLVPYSATGYAFTAPADTNTDVFQVRVRARDDGALGEGNHTTPLFSGWGMSGTAKIDATPPAATHTVTPTWVNHRQYHEEGVKSTFAIAPTDTGAGATGVASVLLNRGAAAYLEDYVYAMEDNGTNVFTLADVVGNEREYTVETGNYDRLPPIVSASWTPTPGSEYEAEAFSIRENLYVHLTYADPKATASDGQSMIQPVKMRYVVSQLETLPVTTAWQTVSSSTVAAATQTHTVDVMPYGRGIWYVYVQTEDVAGNPSATERYGPFFIKNNPPVFVSPTTPEEGFTVRMIEDTVMVIAIKVNDLDKDEMQLTIEMDDAGGHLIMKQGPIVDGVCNLTLTPGADRFTAPKEKITFKLSLEDIEATEERTFYVVIDPVNDPPDAPKKVAIASGLYVGGIPAYKALDTVTVTCDESDDFHWVQETPQEDLLYSVEYSLNGSSWTPVAALQKVPYATEWAFPAPQGNSDAFQVRVCAWDDGAYGNGYDQKGEPLPSAWSLSGMAKLDNTPPQATSTVTPAWINKAQYNGGAGTISTFTIAPMDTGAGATGIKSVTTTDKRVTQVGIYKYLVQNNGVYPFELEDIIGNKIAYNVAVGNYDRLEPWVSGTWKNTEANAFAVWEHLYVDLTYADAAADENDAQSMIEPAKMRYLVSQSETLPDNPVWQTVSSSAMAMATLPHTVDVMPYGRGTWYVYAQTEDVAGNPSATVQYGPFLIKNNPPTFKAELADQWVNEGSAPWTATISVHDYEKDDLTLSAVWDTDSVLADVAITKGAPVTNAMGTTDTYTLTFTLSDPHRFDPRGIEVQLRIQESSGDKAFSETSFMVYVMPVNTPPTNPTGVQMAGTQYKKDDGVTVTWTASDDFHWVQETPQNQLIYVVEYSLNAMSWITAGQTKPGITTFTFPAPAGDSDNFRVRVKAVDDGAFGPIDLPELSIGPQAGEPLASDWNLSGTAKLDNTAPKAANTVMPAWINQAQYDGGTGTISTFTIAPTDTGAGATGVKSVTTTDKRVTQLDKPAYTYQVQNNGTYTFVLEDHVGNTVNYDVIVANYDRLPPTVDCTPTTGTALAVTGVIQITLTYEDQAATADDAKSGIVAANKRYIVTENETIPLSDPLTWKQYTEPFNIVESGRGSWYVYLWAQDNAGNSTYSTERYGPYNVENNPPEFDGETPLEGETLRMTEDTELAIPVSMFDIDGDELTLTVKMTDPEPGHVELTQDEDTLTLTPHANRFTAPGEQIKMELTVTDGNGGSAQRTFYVEIDPVNDPPSAPGKVAITSGVTVGGAPGYKASDTVTVTCEESDDFHWVQETPQKDLRYCVEYTLDGKNWTAVAALQKVAYAKSWTFAAPTGNSDTFQVRVCAWDDGSYGNGYTKKGEPLPSGWSLSGTAKLDNTAPKATSTVMSAWINQAQYDGGAGTISTFTITPTDTGVGATGVKSVTTTDKRVTQLDKPAYTYQVQNNGTYTFALEDQVGNTVNYDVIVANYDRLPPTVDCTPTTGTALAVTGVIQITLTYEDQAATADDAKSGIVAANKRYIVTENETISLSDPLTWKQYTEPFNIVESGRGSWYVYLWAQDNAGNSTYSTERYGPYNVENNPPEFDGETPLEGETLRMTEDTELAIPVSMFDIDGDELTLTVKMTDPEPGHVELTQDEDTLTLTPHANRFTAPGEQIEIRLVLSDGQGGSAQRTFYVEIDPVNDPPSAPGKVAITSGVVVGGIPAYKASDTVTVTCEESDDFHWVQETPQKDLRYCVEYTLDGKNWTPVVALQKVSYAKSWTFAAPAGNSDTFQVRVCAWDDGSYGNGYTKKGEPLPSGWSLSGTAKLDNTAPTGSVAASPTTPTNGTVEITVTASDTGVGATGVAGVTSRNGLTVTETGGGYKANVAVNGTYTFVIADHVGNEKELAITVSNIDKLPPVITCTASAEEVYAGASIQIELSYADAEATAKYASNEVTVSQYALTDSATAPGKDSKLWTDYTEAIELTNRAAYYIHARAQDAVGNETTETFGPFRVFNNPPVFVWAPTDDAIVQDEVFTAVAMVADLDDPVEDLVVNIASGNKSIVPASGVNVLRDTDDASLWHISVAPAAGAFAMKGVDIKLTVTDPFGAICEHTFTLVITGINAPTGMIVQTEYERYVDQTTPQELVFGMVSKLNGNFFPGLWKDNTADQEIGALLYGYSTMALLRNGDFMVDGTVVKEVTISDDGSGNRTYAFTIHEDLAYCDGTPITAKDYVFSTLLMSSPVFTQFGGETTVLSSLVGYDAYRNSAPFTGVRLIDEYSFSLTIAAENLPYFYELSLVSATPYPMGVLAPGCDVRDDGGGAYMDGLFTSELIQETLLSEEGYMRHPKTTSGPYMLAEANDVENTAILVRNERYKGNYEGQKPLIKKLTCKYADPATMLDDFMSGRFDVIGNVSDRDTLAEVMAMANAGEANFIDYYCSGATFLSFGCGTGLTQSLNVRKAVLMSLDVPTFIDSCVQQIGAPIYGYYGLGQWMAGWDPEALNELALYEYSWAGAKELLAEDGWIYNADGAPYDETAGGVRYRMSEQGALAELALTYTQAPDNPLDAVIWEALEQTLLSIGIRLEMAQEGQACDLSTVETCFSMTLDPNFMFSSRDAFQNVVGKTGIKDEKLAELIEDLRRTDTGDNETYYQKWLALQTYWAEVVPMAPLYSRLCADFTRPDLQNYMTNSCFGWASAIVYAYIGR